jgi:hypothetical protein
MKLSNEFPIIAPFCQKRCIGNSEQLLNCLVTECLSDSGCIGGDVAVVVGLVDAAMIFYAQKNPALRFKRLFGDDSYWAHGKTQAVAHAST